MGSSGPRLGLTPAHGYSRPGVKSTAQFNKWYPNQRSENLEHLQNHMVTGQHVNVSVDHSVTWGCVTRELDLGSG